MVGLTSCVVEAATASGLDLILEVAGDIKDVIKAFKDGNLHGNPNAMHRRSIEGHHHEH